MTMIHASGTSESHTSAERATITVRISETSENRDHSINRATQLHNAIVARAMQLRERADATWHSTEPISTNIHHTYPNGNNHAAMLKHVTSSQVRVKLSNLSLVSAIVEEFAQAGAQTSVTWVLTEQARRVREREARIAAVGVTRKIAEDYPGALGEQIKRVVSISDGEAASGPMPGARFAAAAYDSVPAEVTLAEITVAATVAGVFESR